MGSRLAVGIGLSVLLLASITGCSAEQPADSGVSESTGKTVPKGGDSNASPKGPKLEINPDYKGN